MEIQKYFEQWKSMYEDILFYLKSSETEDSSNDDYLNIIQNINTQKIEDCREELEHLISLLICISNNYHRHQLFFPKIERILDHIKNGIEKSMKNIEIFELFESNKRLLLFLFNAGILKIDEKISTIISSKIEMNGSLYSEYFQPQMKNYIKTNESLNNLTDQEFEKKQLEGENDSYICSLIRSDSVEEFIAYVNRTNLPLSSQIEQSIFETNSFLNENNPTLIEYAAFFGSIQIFQYLKMNGVQLTKSLWLYAIHGKNADLIHLLEDNHIKPKDETFQEVFKESIKCHHNDIANYINDNLLNTIQNNQKELDEFVLEAAFQYCNYSFYPENNIEQNNTIFFYLYQYNYLNIVNFLLEIKRDYTESKIDIKKQFFYTILKENNL